jgi:hypothetical protein
MAQGVRIYAERAGKFVLATANIKNSFLEHAN